MVLKINDRITNRKVDFFNQFSLNLRFDSSGSGFAFSYYFDPEIDDLKQLSCIGHNHICTIEDEGELILTGKILTSNFHSAPTKRLVTVRGFSLPGTLEQCNIPLKAYPLQFDNLSLRQIANQVIAPFGLNIIIDASVAQRMDEVFIKSLANVGDTVKGFLQSLASQKNIILSHDKFGNVVFTSAKTNRLPIMDFDVPANNAIPGTEMELDFDGQQMHSEITVVKQPSKKSLGNSAQATVYNPYVPYDYRPKVVTQDSGTDIDTDLAARNLLATELKAMTLKIKTDRWQVNGKLITPNNIITVKNPDVYLYKKSKWFIESVDLTGDSGKRLALLTCVVPEVYNGQTPTYLFAGINTH